MFIHFGNSPASSLSPSLAIKQVILKWKFTSLFKKKKKRIQYAKKHWALNKCPVALCSFCSDFPTFTSSLSPCELFSSRRPGGRLSHQHNVVLHTDSFPGPNCTFKAVNKFYLVQITAWGHQKVHTTVKVKVGDFPSSRGSSFPRHHGVSSIFPPHLLTVQPLTLFLSPSPALITHSFQPHCSLFPNFRSA